MPIEGGLMAWSDEVIILYSWRQRGHPGTYWEWSGHQIPGLKNTHNAMWRPGIFQRLLSSKYNISSQHRNREERKSVGSSHGTGQCSQTVYNFDEATGSSHVESVSKFYFCLMFYGGTWHDLGCHSSMSWQNILSLPQITVFKHGPMTKLDISCFNSPYLWC